MNNIEELFKRKRIEKVESVPYLDKESWDENFSLSKLNASSILIPIILFELLVCFLGAKFYTSIGYDWYSAVILSIANESFYMYFSSKRDIKSSAVKVVLLLISVTTLSYSAYSKDENIIRYNRQTESTIKDLTTRQDMINSELSNIEKEKDQIEKDMELYREFKKATIGNKILAPRRDEIQKRRESLLGEKKSIKNELEAKTISLIKQSIFSNMEILSIKTIISILAFAIVQIAICLALPEILETLKK